MEQNISLKYVFIKVMSYIDSDKKEKRPDSKIENLTLAVYYEKQRLAQTEKILEKKGELKGRYDGFLEIFNLIADEKTEDIIKELKESETYLEKENLIKSWLKLKGAKMEEFPITIGAISDKYAKAQRDILRGKEIDFLTFENLIMISTTLLNKEIHKKNNPIDTHFNIGLAEFFIKKATNLILLKDDLDKKEGKTEVILAESSNRNIHFKDFSILEEDISKGSYKLIYESVYKEDTFDFESFEKRKRLQRIFFASEMTGGFINGYDFQLLKRGPISKKLLKELRNSQKLKEEKISEIKNKELIKLLSDIFDKKSVENKDLWAKSISGYMAVLYIYDELLRVKPTKNEILGTLVNLMKFEEKPDEKALKYAKILWNERKKLVKFEEQLQRN